MAKYTKAQLLRLRENTDNLLRKIEADEKNKYEKLALSFKNSQAMIDRILAKIEGDKTYDQIAILLKGLQTDISEAIKASRPDMSVLSKSVDRLSAIMSSKRDYSDEGIVRNLNRIEKLLTKQDKKPVKDRTDEIVKAIKNIKLEAKDIEFPESISVDNFPPQKIAQPVTNININPLRGYIHTTVATVKTTLTQLPTYGVLDNRRSIIIFNNDSSTTVFIGGSDVTTTNGLPILAQNFSPVIDAGTRMILYGVVSSGTANVRVMEISNEATGG